MDVSAQNIELSGNLFVSGSSTLSESLDVSGDVVVDGTLDVSGGVAFGDRLDVSGTTTLKHNLDVSGDVVVDGTLDVSGDVVFGNRLDVSGDVVVDGTLDVSGTTTLKNLDVSGDVVVDGNVGIGGGSSSEKLKVYGDVNITGNINVDGSFNFNEIIQNTTTVNNTLVVSTQLDISNEGTGPALKVSQLGDGDDQDVAVFNAGGEGDALKIDSSGNTFVYKDINISNNINMTGAIITTNGVLTNFKIPVISAQLNLGGVFLICLKHGGNNECVGRLYYQRNSGHDGAGIVDIVISSRISDGDIPHGFCSYQTNQENGNSNLPHRFSIISGTYLDVEYIGLKYEGGDSFPFNDVYFDGIWKSTGTNSAFQLQLNSEVTDQVVLELNKCELSLLNKRLVINTNGSVGIGTTNPSKTLDVSGTLGVSGLLTATGGISGNLTSNSITTNDLVVNESLNVVGGISGNVTGNLTGNINGNTTIDEVATFDGRGERIVFKGGNFNGQQIAMHLNGLPNNFASLTIKGKGSSINIVEFNNWGGHRVSFFGFDDQGAGTANNVSIHAAKIIKTNTSFSPSSDDRIKKNEKFITNAIQTIAKLRPQIYNKYSNLDCSGDYVVESGLIAQEIYYDAPELRHLVNVSDDADISGHILTSEDPSIDPDYSSWGSSLAGVNYDGFVAYLIKAIQEQQDIINEEKAKNQSQYNDLLVRIQALEESTTS